MSKSKNKTQPTAIVIREFDEQKLENEVIELINKKHLETYKESYVGFFSYSDAAGAIGGGRGHFLWLETYSTLYQFLANYFVVLSPGRLDLDHEKVYKDVAEIIKELAAGEIPPKKAIQEINKAGKHFSQIEWIGELDDLIQGDGEFPKKVREYFFESREDAGSVKEKIGKEHQKAFLEFLSEYGL